MNLHKSKYFKKYISFVIILIILINIMLSDNTLASPNFKLGLEVSQPSGETFKVTSTVLEDLIWTTADSGYIISKGNDSFWYYNVIEGNELKLSNAKYKIDARPNNAVTEDELLEWYEQKFIESIKGIKLNKSDIEIEKGQKEHLSAYIDSNIKPFLEDSIIWTSSDDKIVSVNSIDAYGNDAIITANSSGTAIVRVTSKFTPNLYAECEVTVFITNADLKISNRLNNSIIMLIGHNKAYVNGCNIAIDSTSSDVVPIVKNNRTLIPIMFISESLGATVEWDEVTNTSTIIKSSSVIKFTLHSEKMFKNGLEYTLDSPAELINNRIYVPLRAKVEALNEKVFYERGLLIIAEPDIINDCSKDKVLLDTTIELFNINTNSEMTLYPAVLGCKWGYIDNKGKIIIEPQFKDAMDFVDGLAPVALNGKYGYINKKGNFAIEPNFDRAWKMSDGMGMILLNNKCGFVDSTGRVVIEPKYDFLYTTFFSEGVACVGIGKKCGFIDKQSDILIEPKFSLAFSFSEDLAAVLDSETKRWGFIDKTGNYVIEPIYISAFSFSEGVAPVNENGKWGFINKNGNYIIQPQFKSAGNFKDGFAMVRNDKNKAGFIDKDGNVVIPYKYDIANSFSEGFAVVGITDNITYNSKYGFINKQGDLIIPMNYDYASDFRNGLARVDAGYDSGYINIDGKYVWEPSEFSPFIN